MSRFDDLPSRAESAASVPEPVRSQPRDVASNPLLNDPQWSVTPEMQRARDIEAARLKGKETEPYGQFKGDLPTAALVGEGSKSTYKPTSRFEDLPSRESTPEERAIALGKQILRDNPLTGPTARAVQDPVKYAGEIASIGDIVLGFPGFLVGLGANLRTVAEGTARGGFQSTPARQPSAVFEETPGGAAVGRLTLRQPEHRSTTVPATPRDIWQAGREAGTRVAEPMSGFLQKLLSSSPEFRKAYEEAAGTKAMEGLSSFIDRVGSYVEQKSGGRILKEQVQTGFDTLLAGTPGLFGGRRPTLSQQARAALRQNAAKQGGPMFERGEVVPVRDVPNWNRQEPAGPQTYEGEFSRVPPEELERRLLPGLAAAGGIAYVASEGIDDWEDVAGVVGATILPVALKDPRVIRAKQALRDGVAPDRVWKELGVRRGKDGIWKTMVSDSAMAYRPENWAVDAYGRISPRPKLTLKEAVDHPALFETEMGNRIANLPVVGGTLREGVTGAYTPEGISGIPSRIELAKDYPELALDHLTHELGHAVQERAGMARGGSSREFLPPKWNQAISDNDFQLLSLMEAIEKRENVHIDFRELVAGLERVAQRGDPIGQLSAPMAQLIKSSPEWPVLRRVLQERALLVNLEDAADRRYRAQLGEAESYLAQDLRSKTLRELREVDPWQQMKPREEDTEVRFRPDRPTQFVDESAEPIDINKRRVLRAKQQATNIAKLISQSSIEGVSTVVLEAISKLPGGIANPNAMAVARTALKDFLKNKNTADSRILLQKILEFERAEQLAGEGPSGSSPLVDESVKEKGGMWYPRAVTMLGDPLFKRLAAGLPMRMEGDITAQRVAADPTIRLHQWTMRAIQNYLNKHAGTPTDPLKDIEIPFFGVTRRWEGLTDSIIKATPAGKVAGYEAELARGLPPGSILEGVHQGRIPRDEPIWNLSPIGQRASAASADSYVALTDYLEHVGDYLRQNVPLDKLQQYDLVRAVKETAKRDQELRQAAIKEAQKGSEWKAEQQAFLPALREYPAEHLPARTFRIGKPDAGGIGLSNMNEFPLPAETLDLSWREFVLPKGLTPEQAKYVRLITVAEAANHIGGFEGRPPEEFWTDPRNRDRVPYIATDTQGKPIVNNWTKELAIGRTPEEAWLSGQMALEGNSLAHCVGGYCGDVTSGEARIISLRDSRGRSLATIELKPAEINLSVNEFIAQHPEYLLRDPQPADIPWQRLGHGRLLDEWGAWRQRMVNSPEYKAANAAQLQTVSQIKGPGNFKVPAEYQKYIQDFLNSGKWGAVRDLENVGLVQGKDVFKFDDFRKGAEQIGIKFDPDRFYTTAEVDDIIAGKPSNAGGPGRGEQGGIDPRLLTRLAAATAGAALGAAYFDDSLLGAVGGALGGALLPTVVRATTQSRIDLARMGDRLVGLLSTRLSNASPMIRLKAVELEKNVQQRPHIIAERTNLFFQRLHDMDTPLDRALFRDNPEKLEAFRKILNEGPQGFSGPGATEVRAVLSELEQERRVIAGRVPHRGNWYPLLIKDLPGLKKALGPDDTRILENILREKEVQSQETRGHALTDLEVSQLVDELVFLRQQLKRHQGVLGPEGDHIPPSLQKYYYNPIDSFHMWVKDAIDDIELARFLGKHSDLDKAIGRLTGPEVRAGRMTEEQAEDVRQVLHARHTRREAPTGLNQDIKNITNLGLLANFASAATQMGDSVMVMYAHGLVPTVNAVARKLTGNEQISAKALGLLNHIGEEFTSSRWSADVLQKALKISGFSSVDRIGKDLQLNAALEKYTNWATTEKGRAKIAEKYGEALRDELPDLIRDLQAVKQGLIDPESWREPVRAELQGRFGLKNYYTKAELKAVLDSLPKGNWQVGGNLPQRVEVLLFAELSDMQPISKLEVPEAYINNPNGRIIYQLRTFMLKQLDIARRDAYNLIKSGNPAKIRKGMKNLLWLGLAWGLAGIPATVIQDLMLGREDVSSDELDEMAMQVAMNAAKTFGWSDYSLGQAAERPAGTTLRYTHPIAQMFDDVYRRDARAFRFLLPPVGPIIYNRFLGGNERKELAKERRLRAKGIETELSESAREYKEERERLKEQ